MISQSCMNGSRGLCIMVILPWNRRRRKSWKISLSVSFRAPINSQGYLVTCPDSDVILTLGNWQEANQNEAILVCSPDMITDVPD